MRTQYDEQVHFFNEIGINSIEHTTKCNTQVHSFDEFGIHSIEYCDDKITIKYPYNLIKLSTIHSHICDKVLEATLVDDIDKFIGKQFATITLKYTKYEYSIQKCKKSRYILTVVPEKTTHYEYYETEIEKHNERMLEFPLSKGNNLSPIHNLWIFLSSITLLGYDHLSRNMHKVPLIKIRKDACDCRNTRNIIYIKYDT